MSAVLAPDLLPAVGVHAFVSTEVGELCVGFEAHLGNSETLLHSESRHTVTRAASTGAGTRRRRWMRRRRRGGGGGYETDVED